MSLFVCFLATLRRNSQTDLHEIFREGWQWITEQRLNFGGDPDPYPNRHQSLRRALEEVCTVPLHTSSILFLLLSYLQSADEQPFASNSAKQLIKTC